MKESICPQCHTAFTIDENNFASIVKQVRDSEFEAELERRLEEMSARFARLGEQPAFGKRQDKVVNYQKIDLRQPNYAREVPPGKR